jgi:hypothetical protein
VPLGGRRASSCPYLLWRNMRRMIAGVCALLSEPSCSACLRLWNSRLSTASPSQWRFAEDPLCSDTHGNRKRCMPGEQSLLQPPSPEPGFALWSFESSPLVRAASGTYTRIHSSILFLAVKKGS